MKQTEGGLHKRSLAETMKLRNAYTIVGIYLTVIALAFIAATRNMGAQGTGSPSPSASVSPKPSPSVKPSFYLTTNRAYGSNDRAKVYVSYGGIDTLDFRIYRVKDAARFFKQLNDPHTMGAREENDVIAEYREAKPGLLEKVNNLRISLWSGIKDYFRNQLHRESRVEFNVKFRGLGGENDRLPINQTDYARIPLLNPDQLVKSFRQKLATDVVYDTKMVIMDRMDPGVYLVEAVNTQTASNLRAYTVVVITDLTMIYKVSQSGTILVYTVNRATGEPYKDMDIEVIRGRNTIAKGKTDGNGVLRTGVMSAKPAKGNENENQDEEINNERNSSAPLIIASSKDQFAISDLNTFYYLSDSQEGEDSSKLAAYLYTDRPVYRPNQKVFFKGILRKRTRDGYVSAGSSAHVSIEDNNGGKILEKDIPLSPRGTFFGDADLLEGAPLGEYALIAKSGEAEQRYYFRVEEYKKPEYKVTVDSPRPFVNVGEKTSFNVNAKYFFGAPVAGATVKYFIYRSRYYHPWWKSADDADDFISKNDDNDDPDFYGFSNDVVKEGEARTGKDGKLVVDFEVPRPEAKSDADYVYRLEANVTDASRREISGSGSFVGTRGPLVAFAETEKYVYRKGEQARIHVRTSDYQGKPAGTKLTLAFVKREWIRTERADATGKWDRYEYKLKETELSRADVTTNSQGEADYLYQVTALGNIGIDTIIDWNGTKVPSSGGSLWATDENSPWGEYASPNAAAIKLVPDKKSYKPGDTARVLAMLPTENANLLVTTELDDVLSYRTVKAAGKSIVLDIPITSKDAPDVFLNVCYVRDGEFYDQDKMLAVPAKDKFLKLEIIPDKSEYKPREVATYTVSARNPDGSPASGAEISFGVVDEAVYSIAPENAGDIRRAFYGRRYKSVSTSFSTQFQFTGYSGDKPVKLAQNKRSTQLADFKNENQYAEVTIRKEFKDTAFWVANTVTGPDGRAKVSVNLPDNLTTWRATARAVTQDLKVGAAVAKVVERKDLILRLETPRFLAEGDTTTLSGVVHNYLNADKSTKIEIQVTGAQLLDPASQTVTIEKQGLKRIDWRIKATGLGQITLLAKALTDAESDAVELPLTVLPAGLKETQAKSLALANDTDEQSYDVNLPRNIHPEARKLRLEVSPSIASTLFGALDYLTSYPYGCTEQTMSSFLPNVIVTRAVQQIKSASVSSGANLAGKVSNGLKRLYGYQHEDGGWGWWKDDKTDPFMTAYVVDGLNQALKAGYGVESYRINRGREALKRMIEAHKAEDGKPIDPEFHAYMVYAYVSSGENGANYLNDVFNNRSQLQPYGKALLALALKARNDSRAEAVANDLERTVSGADGYAHWQSTRKPMLDFTEDNSLEATTMAVRALSLIKPKSDVTPRAAKWLVANRKNGYFWDSTKHTAFAVYALTDYLTSSQEMNPDYSLEVYLNGEQIMTRRITSAGDPTFTFERKGSTLAPMNQLRVVKRGRGVLYFSSNLEYFSADENVAAKQAGGLSLSREFLRLKVDENAGKWTTEPLSGDLKSGDYIVSKLTLNGPKGRQVMIEDPIPAGCEQIRNINGLMLDYTLERWTDWFSSQEFRDNRTVIFVDYFGGKAVFQYAMRVQIPGDFRVGPARAEFMYQPEIKASTKGDKKTILDSK